MDQLCNNQKNAKTVNPKVIWHGVIGINTERSFGTKIVIGTIENPDNISGFYATEVEHP